MDKDELEAKKAALEVEVEAAMNARRDLIADLKQRLAAEEAAYDRLRDIFETARKK